AEQNLPLVVAERGGSWDDAVNPDLPPTSVPLITGDTGSWLEESWLSSVSCPSVGHCEAGGFFTVPPVGGNPDMDQMELPLLVEANDASWTASQSPLPEDALAVVRGNQPFESAHIVGMACVDQVGCEGVGDYGGPFNA